MDWKSYLENSWKFPEELPQGFVLSEAEKEYFDKIKSPVLINRYYASLFDGAEDDPLRRMAVPRIEESVVLDCERNDPLDEYTRQPVPRVIHRYKNRVVLLVSTSCALYCRHCFRRNYLGLAGQKNRLGEDHHGVINDRELESAYLYLSEHREVEEVLISGGDPLILGNRRIKEILDKLKNARPDILLRLGTRFPAVLPMRFDSELIEILRTHFPVWISAHINHPRELTNEAVMALGNLVKNGIPVVNQAVLLRGVNDDVKVLSLLSRKLLQSGVKPYYLFQGDMAEGTSHLRVPLEKGWNLMHALRSEVSGLGMPQYAMDLPDGGGKIPLTGNYFETETLKDGKEYYQFISQERETRFYPKEK